MSSAQMLLAAAFMLTPAIAAAQAPAADPWTRVPAFPKSCYAGADDVTSRLASAVEAIGVEKGLQQELNSALSARLGAMDPMEQAQRTQAYMMKNPTEAMQVMQAVQTAGTEANAVRGASGGDYLKGTEFEELETNFRTALARALDPTHVLIAELKRTKSQESAHGFTYSFPVAADETRFLALVSQLNADYERLCATWLVARGTIPAWMRNHRTYLADEVIPGLEGADRAAAGQIRIVLGTQNGEYRSMAALDVVEDYLRKASRMNALRRQEKFVPPTGFTKRTP